MARRIKHPVATRRNAARSSLRSHLEAARLELRALYRALDRLSLAQHLPPQLRRLQEFDADFAEALWVLDQPPGRFDLAAMTRDTLASLNKLSRAREALLGLFDDSTRARIEGQVEATRGTLSPEDAYLEIRGRDPAAQ